MLAIQAREAGGPGVLQAVDIPVPTPGPGEILIRHKAIGLNFIDTYQRSGLYPVRYPAILGGEAAGIVEAVGTGVTRFAVGDRAAYGTGVAGAYAEAQVAPEGRCVRVPDDVPLETAAAGLLKGMTAEFLLRRCHPLAAGETILIHAAAGGVGQILTQWAKAIGATVLATAGGADKLALTKDLGADHGVDYRTEDVAARVREITQGRGVRVVYDGVGAATFDGSLDSLRVRGTMVLFGGASGQVPPFDIQRLNRGGSLKLTRPNVDHFVLERDELLARAKDVFGWVADGSLTVRIGGTYPLADAARAQQDLAGRRTTGKLLLLP